MGPKKAICLSLVCSLFTRDLTVDWPGPGTQSTGMNDLTAVGWWAGAANITAGRCSCCCWSEFNTFLLLCSCKMDHKQFTREKWDLNCMQYLYKLNIFEKISMRGRSLGSSVRSNSAPTFMIPSAVRIYYMDTFSEQLSPRWPPLYSLIS